MRILSGVRGRLAATIGAIGIAACLAFPAGAAAAPPSESMSLVFASGAAREVAGQLSVPVRCIGGATGFCSGVLTLSGDGHKVSIPFSVEGGTGESIFVPLRLDGRRSRKVLGVAGTAQPGGPPATVSEVLSVR